MTPLEGARFDVRLPGLSGPEFKNSVPDKPGEAFSEVLVGALDTANQRIRSAEEAAQAFAAGAQDDIHGTTLALSKADIELRMVGTIRNKVVDAFYELWRMQI